MKRKKEVMKHLVTLILRKLEMPQQSSNYSHQNFSKLRISKNKQVLSREDSSF
jgi:hypothetical protein